jgi:hypothetical protein
MSLTPEARAAQIESDLQMASDMRKDAEEKEAKEKKMDAEHNGETLNKLLTGLDSINAKFDSFTARMDAYGARLDGAEAAMQDRRKKKDAVEEEGESEKIPFRKDGEKEIEEEGDPRPLKADRRGDSYADSHRPRPLSDEQRDEVAAIQTRADSVCSAWGNSVDKPMMNELPDEYLRRTARKHQTHSAQWKEVNLRELSGKALENAADAIFKDSFAMAGSDEPWKGTGGLREVRRVNRETGHIIKEFYGDPMSWMQQFTGGRRLAKFHLDADHRIKR